MQGKKKEAEKALRKVAAINGKIYPENLDLSPLYQVDLIFFPASLVSNLFQWLCYINEFSEEINLYWPIGEILFLTGA